MSHSPELSNLRGEWEAPRFVASCSEVGVAWETQSFDSVSSEGQLTSGLCPQTMNSVLVLVLSVRIALWQEKACPARRGYAGAGRGWKGRGTTGSHVLFFRDPLPHLGLSKHCPVLYPPLNSCPLPLPQFRGPVWHIDTASHKHLSLFLFINLSYLLTNEEKKEMEQIKLFTMIHPIPAFILSSTDFTYLTHKAFQTGQSSLSWVWTRCVSSQWSFTVLTVSW